MAALIGYVYRAGPDEPPNVLDAAFVRLLMRGDHPLMTPQDFALVEETATGTLVACACLWRQTWAHGGVRFPIGRPELVASHPDYRQRGYIRAIFGALHARSAARDDVVQAIPGIRYFYRQFGYEYALDLDGGRTGAFAEFPAAGDEPEPLALRPAERRELPTLRAAYAQGARRSLVTAAPDAAYWRHKLSTAEDPGQRWRLLTIADGSGAARGYVELAPVRPGPTLVARQVELADPADWPTAALPIVRALRAMAATLPTRGEPGPPTGVSLVLGREHPLYAALDGVVGAETFPPYAWYVRVPDLPGFLRRLAPVLAARLAGSAFRGFTGELLLDCYRGGLRIAFAHGRLVATADWRRPVWGGQEHAAFPPLLFLQLLFGFRSLDELRAAHPDVWRRDAAAPLLSGLFPKVNSRVLPLD